MKKIAAPLSSVGQHDIATGFDLINSPLLNKLTAFSEKERDALRIRGLLPPRVFNMDEQEQRTLMQFRSKPDNLEKYIFLTTLQNRNETLFYRLLLNHIAEMMPIVYTPTVGQACLEYGSIFRHPRGLWISIKDRGHIAEILRNWQNRFAKIIVVTDGERILGLGDLGALGMGIPIGKLSLYTACAGIHPYYCLPICLDVGTNNEKLRSDPLYIGLTQKRASGEEYETFIEEFVTATQEVFPGSLIQFEDFGNHNAFATLNRYRNRVCCFNDDIQGTAAVALAGIIAAARHIGKGITDQKLLFLGAGEAGTGIGEYFVRTLIAHGMTETDARQRCWYVDSKGLLVKNRGDKLPAHKQPFAHDAPHLATLAEAVDFVKPTALVGVSGMAQTFTPEILKKMATLNQHPVIFALSNPTSKAECTAEQAYTHTDGRAIFASGSPFEPVNHKGKTYAPGQGNNVYIFPGVGMGALSAASSSVTDAMFLAAAERLADEVKESDLAQGRVYPDLSRIREISLNIATAVATIAYDQNLAGRERPADIRQDIYNQMFRPEYLDYLA